MNETTRRQFAPTRAAHDLESSVALHGPMNVLVRIATLAGGDSLAYVHEFISHYAKDRYRIAIAESINLAAFELLQNGIAYGSVSSPVVLEIAEQGSWLIVRVSNDAISARISRLVELVERLSLDAEATYVDQVRRSIGTPGRALLGLARVAHEGAMKLNAQLTPSGVVVTACRRN